MAARINDLLDALAEQVRTNWNPTGPDLVRRCYVAPVYLDRKQRFAGRQVYLFPASQGKEPADRGEDYLRSEVTCDVVEEYPDGMPVDSDEATAWLDDRLGFVEAEVVNRLDFGRSILAVAGGRGVYTESYDWTPYDGDYLETKNLFWSRVQFVFRELITV